jgi:sulfur-oxidizing protein SoxX
MAKPGSRPSRRKPLADPITTNAGKARKQPRGHRAFLAITMFLSTTFAPKNPAAFTISGDRIETSLTGKPGNAEAGRAIVSNRQIGLCVLCHAGPFGDDHFQGSIGPNLAGVGSRLAQGQIRLRVADARHLNPDSVMPSYANTTGLNRVAPAFQGRPILSDAQIEDVVAYLATLRAAP